jgi:hypothetical protein
VIYNERSAAHRGRDRESVCGGPGESGELGLEKLFRREEVLGEEAAGASLQTIPGWRRRPSSVEGNPAEGGGEAGKLPLANPRFNRRPDGDKASLAAPPAPASILPGKPVCAGSLVCAAFVFHRELARVLRGE